MAVLFYAIAMDQTRHTDSSLILFGAFDRHNFGDLLFAHVASRLFRDHELIFAGLADRDLRCHGGHRVESLAALAAKWDGRPVSLVHAGGEILACSAWQAAVMLQDAESARAAVARYDFLPQDRLAWASRQLGMTDLAPYAASRGLFSALERLLYLGVGGVDLPDCEPAMQSEVFGKLGQADVVSVRDSCTLALLEAAGIAASLIPDPAVMVAELFGEQIRECSRHPELAHVLARFPRGYLAVQFSADFGDDATLAALADQLGRLATASGLGVVFFCAGAAPWHDSPEVYRRVLARLCACSCAIFESLDVWDICALIAFSRGYCGSSLHGRIVAMAYGLPRLNLVHSAGVSKQRAFAETWEATGLPTVVGVDGIAQVMQQALAAEPGMLRGTACRLVDCFIERFSAIWPGTAGSGR